MMYIGVYKNIKKGIGLYGKVIIEVHLNDSKTHKLIDYCSWDAINKSTSDTNIDIYTPWKNSALEGIKYALSRVKTKHKYQINLIDIDGHVSHSNSSSIFAASIIAIFTSFDIKLNHEDYTELTNFVFHDNNGDNVFILPSFQFLRIGSDYVASNEKKLS